MGENLRLRAFIVITITLVCAWVVAKPIFIDHKPVMPLGLDIRGGVTLRYEFLENPKDPSAAQKKVDTTLQVFQSRLDALGTREMSIRAIGTSQIEVSVPGITSAEAESITKTLESVGRLEFRLEAWSEPGADPEKAREQLKQDLEAKKKAGVEINAQTDFSNLSFKGGEGSNVTYRWLPYGERFLKECIKTGRVRGANGEMLDPAKPTWDTPGAWALIRFDNREGHYFTGADVKQVYQAQDNDTGLPACGFEIQAGRATQLFADFTEANIGKSQVITLDDQIQSVAIIQSRIPGTGVINGGSDGFAPEELKRLISVINSGALLEKPRLAFKFAQGPNLGEAAIHRGVEALAVTFLIIGAFMLIYYRLNGLIAVIALIANMLILIAAMAWLEATLTLPGVAGFILTVGMAVDANILIAERIREELDKGKTVAQAVRNGFDRAFIPIFDGHLTTFITGFFLYRFGTGTIRGFAVSLMIGLAASMLTGVYFSHVIFDWLVARGLKKITMLRILSNPNFKFLKWTKKLLVLSGLIIVFGGALFLWLPKEKFGMDFTGGFEVQIALKEPATQDEIGEKVRGLFKAPEVVSIDAAGGKAKRFQIKVKQTDIASELKGLPEGADNTALANFFADKVGKLFEGRLIESGINGFKLGTPDANGKQTVEAELLYEAPIKKADLAAALAKTLNSSAVEGDELGTKFKVSGQFTRAPANDAVARAALAVRVAAPSGGGDVQVSDPMPAKSYVGPRAGRDLRDSAIQALIFSFIAEIIYGRLRFSQFRYGFAAVLGILHDVLITVGCFAFARFLGLEIEMDLTMIAALLTIVGYSINDTIVIFDRIRENLPKLEGKIEDIIDISLNQTLSRTLLTSLTVLLSMVILFAYNVGQRNALEGFGFAMIVGVITGTYSSVYVASPFVIWIAHLAERRKRNRQATPGAGSSGTLAAV
jgi:SecD/SecF fusion protein